MSGGKQSRMRRTQRRRFARSGKGSSKIRAVRWAMLIPLMVFFWPFIAMAWVAVKSLASV